MTRKLSAGLLVYRRGASPGLEVLIAHMGGPLWAKKDEGGWSIPKGEYLAGEDPLRVARREFQEELGSDVPGGDLLLLGDAKQPSGKIIRVWAVQGDLDTSNILSNEFEMEWPRGSGVFQKFPEIDRAEWFPPEVAKRKLVSGQTPFIDRLLQAVSGLSSIEGVARKEATMLFDK